MAGQELVAAVAGSSPDRGPIVGSPVAPPRATSGAGVVEGSLVAIAGVGSGTGLGVGASVGDNVVTGVGAGVGSGAAGGVGGGGVVAAAASSSSVSGWIETKVPSQTIGSGS